VVSKVPQHKLEDSNDKSSHGAALGYNYCEEVEEDNYKERHSLSSVNSRLGSNRQAVAAAQVIQTNNRMQSSTDEKEKEIIITTVEDSLPEKREVNSILHLEAS
jgi:hypothetical protein